MDGARVSSIEAVPVLLFTVGARRCALAVSAVRGVTLPRALDAEREGIVVGVVRDGARVIPVLDARRWLGVTAAPPARPRWIIVRRDARALALAVDAVEGVGEATVAASPPTVERGRVARYFAHPVGLCPEPDLAAMFALAEGAR